MEIKQINGRLISNLRTSTVPHHPLLALLG
jgi:hypothetical protein